MDVMDALERAWAEPDGREGALAESDDVLRVLGASEDGYVTHYAYRGYRFTIERSGRWSWFCFSGYKRPGDMLCTCREDGWGSRSREKVVRHVTRSIDKCLREEGRRLEAGGERRR